MKIKKEDIKFLLHIYLKMKKDKNAKRRFKSFTKFCEGYILKEKELQKKLLGTTAKNELL